MRASSLMSIFTGAIAASGMPCGNPCYDAPESTFTVPYPADDAGVGLDESSGGGPLDLAFCRPHCQNYHVDGCHPIKGDAGTPLLECHVPVLHECSGGGRPTRGVVPGAIREANPVADYLAASAALEASSVESFRRLRKELRGHGAPRALLRASSRAARDERRHARQMTQHARRHGGHAPMPHTTAPLEPRSIEELAVENAVEGCVVETYGALLALWQANNANDHQLRGSLRRIARDEARHAGLAWSFASWLEGRLDRAARERVRRARARALGELRARVRAPQPELVAQKLVPDAATALALVDHLFRSLPASM